MAKCPKCGSAKETWLDDQLEFIGPDESAVSCTFCCDACGTKWRAEYSTELQDTEILKANWDEED